MTIDQPLDTVDMMLNMGPQHPSTHGVFRMVLTVDGENIVDVVPHIGYLHRGSEKLCEAEDYRQIIDLFDRLDYVSSFNNELPYVMAVEKLMGLEVPERAQYIRLIMCELNRIASHLLFYGAFGADCGAITPFLYGFREREQMQALFESVSGARMMHGYFRVGGVFRDLPDDFNQRLDALLPVLEKGITECEDLLSKNELFLERTIGVGVIDAETAIDFGVTGPNLRASGLAYDLRKDDPYLLVPEIRLQRTCWRQRRLLRPLHGADGGDVGVDQDSEAGRGADAAWPDYGQDPPHPPPSQGRRLREDRESPG